MYLSAKAIVELAEKQHTHFLNKEAVRGNKPLGDAAGLKKGGGGPATMMGHALSGTPLGGADNLIRKAQDRFTMFADGGAVKKPPGPSAKERREIRSMIERGKGVPSSRPRRVASEPAAILRTTTSSGMISTSRIMASSQLSFLVLGKYCARSHNPVSMKTAPCSSAH